MKDDWLPMKVKFDDQVNDAFSECVQLARALEQVDELLDVRDERWKAY